MSESLSEGLRREWAPGYRVDLRAALGPLRRGVGDPCWVPDSGGIWRASLTPAGATTVHLTRTAVGVEAVAWGPGGKWALEHLPRLLGHDDDPSALDPKGHPLIERAVAKYGALRLGATDVVWESLVAAILEQKVTGKQAHAGWRWLVRSYGAPAPGPVPPGLRLPVTPEACRSIPSWEWHKAGVQPAQSRTIVQIAALASRFESLDSAIVDQRLRSFPGVGVWTSAEVRQRSHGDPDAISVGDYHLATFVGNALIGEPVDDVRMEELLHPWLGQRQRVVRLLGRAIAKAERHGPRATITDHRWR